MRRRWLTATILFLGCPPSVTSTPNGPTAPDPVVATAAPIEATVVSARTTGESIPASVVAVRWSNPSDDEVVVSGYRVEWPGGAKDVFPERLFLRPREAAIRTVRVDAASGDLSKLEAARILSVASARRPAPTSGRGPRVLER